MLKSLVVLCLVAVLRAAPEGTANKVGESPLVTTPLGQVQGSVILSRLGKNIYSFRGIRYAKAPINELRFKPPVAEEKWEGVYNATEDKPLCPQATTDPISEDCLFLNVYTTKIPKDSKEKVNKPVIVYIPSGGFYSLGGASYWVGPNYLLDQDVVLVTFNYRLGALGFLSTSDKEAVGNFGLKDQVLALTWVKNNIATFGGDPNSVTIMGEGAGAISVTLHLVSPMSSGLFHKAIAMSGSIFDKWPLSTNQLDLAKKQAKLVNCPDDTSANIIKCLKTKTPQELGESQPKFKEFADDPVYTWLPVIEPDNGQPRFLTDHPIKLVQNGQFAKVPFLTGITNDEFAARAFHLLSKDSFIEEFNKNFEKNAPIAFNYERNNDQSKLVSKALKSFYLQDAQINQTSLNSLIQLYSDSLVGFGVNRGVKLIAEKHDQLYYYKFSYPGRYSQFYAPNSNKTTPFGVVHRDELIYLFHIARLFPLFKESSPTEVEMVNKLCVLWSNFAKTGKPIPEATDKLDNVKWEPFTTKTQKYLDIGNKLSLHEKLFEKRYAEWEKLYPLSSYAKKNFG